MGGTDIGIRKSEFVANTQFLSFSSTMGEISVNYSGMFVNES